MTTQTGLNHHERGLELASAGRHQEGLNCMREHLRIAPNDAQALNDAGAILHCLGRTDDAIGLPGEGAKLQERQRGDRVEPGGGLSGGRAGRRGAPRCSTTWSGWAF